MSENPYESPKVANAGEIPPADDDHPSHPNLLVLLITTVFIIPPVALITGLLLALLMDFITRTIMSWL